MPYVLYSLTLIWILSVSAFGQVTMNTDYHEKYKESCAIWEKTDKKPTQTLTDAELEPMRYWIDHQPEVVFGHDIPRMAAITAGTARDAKSYDALEKLYLDTNHMEILRAEAFRAIAKIDPKRAAHYVIKEASTGTSRFAAYAEIALKEAYSTSVTAMRDNVMKSFKKRNQAITRIQNKGG